MATLKERYNQEVVPKLKQELGIKNPMRVPRLRKVVVNMGIGVVDKDEFQTHVTELARVTGLSRPDAGLGNRALVKEGYAVKVAEGTYRLKTF